MDDGMTPADRLEKALSDNEARKKAAADLAAKSAPETARLKALLAKAAALPESERRAVLDAAGIRAVSAAPKPIEPVRGSGTPKERPAVAGRVAPPVRWAMWLALPSVELWRAVMLSMNVEPSDEWAVEVELGLMANRRFMRLPPDFFHRMSDCQKALTWGGPIEPLSTPYPGVLRDPDCKVHLREVAAFLVRVGAVVPDELRAIIEPAPNSSPESAQDRQDRRLRRLRELGDDMRPVSDTWQTANRSGALAALEREEQAAGRPMSDKSDIRKDLGNAAERERNAQTRR